MPSIHLHSGQEGVERREGDCFIKVINFLFLSLSYPHPLSSIKNPMVGVEARTRIGSMNLYLCDFTS